MFGSIGMPELIIILVIALIIFGPRKLPELGRSLGRASNEFKKASNELRSTLEEEIRVEEQRDERATLPRRQHGHAAPLRRRPLTPPRSPHDDRAGHRHVTRVDQHGPGALPEVSAAHDLVPIRTSYADERAPARSRVRTATATMTSATTARRRCRFWSISTSSGSASSIPSSRSSSASSSRSSSSSSIFDFVMRPLQAVLPAGQTLIYTEPTEAFMLYLKIAAIAGLMIASAAGDDAGLAVHRARPVLAREEVGDSVRGDVDRSSSSLGAAFSHYVVFPLTWKFFVSFTSDYLTFMPRIEPAFALYMKMLLAFGLVFQMPTIVLFLARMGVVTAGSCAHIEVRAPHYRHRLGDRDARRRRRVARRDVRAAVPPLHVQHRARVDLREEEEQGSHRRGGVMRAVTLALGALVVAVSTASAQTAPVVIKARTVLDGKGATLTNVAIVVQDSKIVRIEPAKARCDLRPDDANGHARLDRHSHAHRRSFRSLERAPAYGRRSRNARADDALWFENAYKTLHGRLHHDSEPGQSASTRTSATGSTTAACRDLVFSPRSIRSSITPARPTDSRVRSTRAISEEGADFVKIFATGSIRDGGLKTMTDAQIQAACGEAKKLGKRTIVHAQGPDSAKSAILAGCTTIEHGNRLTDEDITLMVEHGTYFDSNNHLMIHNYLENKPRFLGIGNYTEEGFAYMERGLRRATMPSSGRSPRT